MAPGIGTASFIFLEGEMDPEQERLESWAIGGEDGWGHRKTGSRGDIAELVSFASISSASAVDTTVASYAALVGTRVSVETSTGSSYTSVLVKNVRFLDAHAVSGAVGALSPGHEAVLRCVWTLQL